MPPLVAHRNRNPDVQVVILDWSGFRVRVKVVGVASHHAVQVAQRRGGEDVLVGDDAHRLYIVGILALTCSLLCQFDGHVVRSKLMAYAMVSFSLAPVS
jgi:hypothetical protein